MIVLLAVDGETAGHDLSDALALGLGSLGEVAVTVDCTMVSGDAVAERLARAEDDHGRLHGVVLVSAGMDPTQPGNLADLGPTDWRDRVERPLRRTLACFQGAHRRLRIEGGSLVVLVPTLSLVGSAGFAPWAAVAEGQRSLAKAAARAWGGDAVTVNCVAVPGALLAPAAPGQDLVTFDRPGQPPPALGPAPDLRTLVAPVLASLLSDRWTGVTGATVAVDGGVWMTP